MLSRKSKVATVGLAGACAIGFSLELRAGADKVAFPENYAAGVQYMTVDKPDTKQVHVFYAMPTAIEAARNGNPMPDGTVFTVVRYAAQADAQGNPVKGADGRFSKGDLLGYAAMEKHAGWGSEYPDELRNGEWEYRTFTKDKKPNESTNLKVCFECHKSMAQKQDFVQSYQNLKSVQR